MSKLARAIFILLLFVLTTCSSGGFFLITNESNRQLHIQYKNDKFDLAPNMHSRKYRTPQISPPLTIREHRCSYIFGPSVFKYIDFELTPSRVDRAELPALLELVIDEKLELHVYQLRWSDKTRILKPDLNNIRLKPEQLCEKG